MSQEPIAKGVYLKDVAAELGVHPRTVKRTLGRGGPPVGKRPRARRSKRDPFKPAVERVREEDVWNAVVIVRELQALGYSGKARIRRASLHPKRPVRALRARVRLASAASA